MRIILRPLYCGDHTLKGYEMSDKFIKQHHNMAMGKSVAQGECETPFKMGPDHGKPARGQLLDSQRGATKSGKTNHGYSD